MYTMGDINKNRKAVTPTPDIYFINFTLLNKLIIPAGLIRLCIRTEENINLCF